MNAKTWGITLGAGGFGIFLCVLALVWKAHPAFGAQTLGQRLAGRILLQVEQHGEAWYVNPVDGARYYMKDGATAYEMMRSFGLGISEADYQKIEAGNTELLSRLKGKIILRVQLHGEAYYLHPDGGVFYLKDGPAAYQLMREKSLGIRDTDLQLITSKTLVPIVSTPTSTTPVASQPSTTVTPPIMQMGPKINLSTIMKAGSEDTGSSTLDIIPAPFPIRVTDGVGAFRSQCLTSHMLFDDPLVFPGQPGASHLHVFFGNTRMEANIKPGTLRAAGTTGTCAGGSANLSGYWVPAVVDENGTVIKPVRNITYYKSGYFGIAPEDIKEFPQGLRMIAGDKNASSEQEYAYWGCTEVFAGHFGSIPTNCPKGTEHIEMFVEFPQCWDGVHLDSEDHMSHMAYPVNGKCPSTHPVPIPAISYNIQYPYAPGLTNGWRLSSDMYDESLPGGFSAHGDWWDGWDHVIVKKWMKNCVNAGLDCAGGLISDTEYLKERE